MAKARINADSTETEKSEDSRFLLEIKSKDLLINSISGVRVMERLFIKTNFTKSVL